MDISRTVEPRSDQLNFDDVATRTIAATISEVRKGTAEQPVEIHLDEYPGRPYKPSKSMRRVLVAAWTADAALYAGRRIRLYGDPDVTFGRDKVGGIKIEALSHIDGPVTVPLTVTRGRRASFTVQPLPEAPVDPDAVARAVTAITNASTDGLPAIINHARKLGIANHPDITTALAQKQGNDVHDQ